MHQDSNRNLFPTYKVEQINQIAIVIADESIYEEKTDTYVSTTLKDHTDVNNFIKKLGGLCKEHGFEIETFGTREQMAAKLYKKDGKNLMTEEEGLDFGIEMLQEWTAHNGQRSIPTMGDLQKWRNNNL